MSIIQKKKSDVLTVPEPRTFGVAKQNVPLEQAPFGATQASFSQFEIAFATQAVVRSEGNE